MNIKDNEKLKKILGYCWTVFQVIIIIYVIFMTLFILFKNQYGYTQFGSYTLYNVDADGEENNTGFIKGDLVAIKAATDINEGDLIYYYSVDNETYVIRSSEVTRIENAEDNDFYTVLSDNTAVVDKKVVGKQVTIFPHVGTLLIIVCSKFGFIFLVLLPILVVFGYQIYDFIRIMRNEKRGHLEGSSKVVDDDKVSNDSDEKNDLNKIEKKTEQKDNSEVEVRKLTTIERKDGKKEIFDDEIL